MHLTWTNRNNCSFTTVPGHEGGRNRIFIVSRDGIKRFVLRISDIGDRNENEYLADNGYRYREGAPLSEYFYNTGKALGAIHRLSKLYTPVHPHTDYFDKYNMTYLNSLISDDCEREGEDLDYEDIEDAARCLIETIPYAGFGEN